MKRPEYAEYIELHNYHQEDQGAGCILTIAKYAILISAIIFVLGFVVGMMIISITLGIFV